MRQVTGIAVFGGWVPVNEMSDVDGTPLGTAPYFIPSPATVPPGVVVTHGCAGTPLSAVFDEALDTAALDGFAVNEWCDSLPGLVVPFPGGNDPPPHEAPGGDGWCYWAVVWVW